MGSDQNFLDTLLSQLRTRFSMKDLGSFSLVS
jgi:hypothetical protein